MLGQGKVAPVHTLKLYRGSRGIEGYGTIILPAVLYGWETCSLTLREERRLRVFEENIWA